MELGPVPTLHHFFPLGLWGSRADEQRDLAVVELQAGLRVRLDHRKQIASPPKVMALPLDELPRCLPGLRLQLGLLVANPAELGDHVGAGDFQPGGGRRDQGDVAGGWMDRQMHMLDRLARHRNG